jgi:hypothetical protein
MYPSPFKHSRLSLLHFQVTEAVVAALVAVVVLAEAEETMSPKALQHL